MNLCDFLKLGNSQIVDFWTFSLSLWTPCQKFLTIQNSCLVSLLCFLFQVDLEHNQYRSFQGLTCLMQISTRTEDFVVDTLKLRVHVGPYLREVFKDPSKRKV